MIIISSTYINDEHGSIEISDHCKQLVGADRLLASIKRRTNLVILSLEGKQDTTHCTIDDLRGANLYAVYNR